MLTLYLSCLVVGGVFVGLSALGAFGKDVEADSGGVFALDGDIDADVDADVDVDADADVDADGEVGHAGDVEHGLTVSDATRALAPQERHARKVWLPFLSLRFWTYGSAFFGLTGTLLTTLTAASALFVAVTSGATGVGIGTLSAWMVRWLRRPVGASIRLGEYAGATGELLMSLRSGGVTRIRLRVHERERTMLAVAPEPTDIEAGTKVMVLGLDEQGRALIEPERSIFDEEK